MPTVTTDQPETLLSRQRCRCEWIGPTIVVIVGVICAVMTWNISGDLLVDSGRDLYTSQQMNAGRRLFADISYLYGPLPPYVLAWLFSIFGESVQVVRGFNLLLLAGTTAMLYSIIRRLSDGLLASFSCSIFLIFFGFGQLTPLRNYNFLLPYTNSATYGFILCVTTLWSLLKYGNCDQKRTNRFVFLGIAAASAGLTFLVKPEFCLAAIATLFSGIVAILFVQRPRFRPAIHTLATLMGSAVLVPAIVLLLMSLRVPWNDLWNGTLAGFYLAADARVTSMPLFRDGLGIAAAEKNVPDSILWVFRYVAAIFPALIAALQINKHSPKVKLAATAALIIYAGGAIFLLDDSLWPGSASRQERPLIHLGQGIPLIVLAAFVGMTYGLIRRRNLISAERWIFCVFCGAMLLRMLLNTRIYQYGFVSASPAVLLIIMVGGGWLPRLLNERDRSGLIVRFATIGLILGIAWPHWRVQQNIRRQQTIQLPRGFRSGGEKGEATLQALRNLAQRATPGDTLAVWPEGAGINYVSRLPNPTPYELMNPLGIIRAGGEDVVTAAYAKNPPTWIMLVQLNTSETGLHPFGIAYAQNLREMVQTDYQPQWQSWPAQSQPPQFGIVLFRRRTDAPASQPLP